MEYDRSKEDICAHCGDDYGRQLGAIAPPIYQTSLFTRKNGDHGYSYSRGANPTVELAECKIAALEGGDRAVCFSSGMAAISSALLHHVEAGSHIVALSTVYGGTRALFDQYLTKFGIETTYVAGDDLQAVARACRPTTRAIYLESPTSVAFLVVDLRAISEFARGRGIATIIDNTWSTPLFQNPLSLGIDVVVHSCSKYLGGHSDVVAGVVVGREETMQAIRNQERSLLGGNMDPHQAWLLIRGLRTLPVRMKQHQESALQIASFLEAHPRVTRVLHPGLSSHPQHALAESQMSGYSGLFSFGVKWDGDQAGAFMQGIESFEVGPSWGGYESLINFLTTGLGGEDAERLSIPDRVFRVSVGLENPQTLMDALEQGLRGR